MLLRWTANCLRQSAKISKVYSLEKSGFCHHLKNGVNPFKIASNVRTFSCTRGLKSSDPTKDQEGNNIFTKILEGSIPAEFVYKDDRCVAFKDVNPQAPTHILIIPRKWISSVSDMSQHDSDLLGHMIYVAKLVADKSKLDQGYRLVINNGEHGQQTVQHLHVHVLGGRQLKWPPG